MKSYIVIGAFALLAPGLAAGDEPRKVRSVKATLSQIRHNPDAYRGLEVTIEVQYASTGNLQNPFFTRFVSSQFANFWVWDGSQPIWRQEQYDDMFALLFIEKTNKDMAQIFELRRYDRIQVTGVIRDVFQAQPWIEVSTIKPVSGGLDTATLSHLYRGEEHMRRREWSRAIAELSLAPAEGVPGHVRAVVHKNMGICYLRLGESDTGLQHLASARELEPDDHEISRLLNVAQSRPSTELDRRVAAHAVPDARRPFWDAFENVGATPKK